MIGFLGYDPEPPSPVSIADYLRAQRRARGWSQRDAAAYMGVDPSTWSSWELGGTIMKPAHRKLVADFTGMDHDEVYRCMKRRWNEHHGKPTRPSE